MPLPIFDTQDQIPEAFRSEYEERDGKWHPRDILALKKEREANREAQKQLEQMQQQLRDLEKKAAAKDAKVSDQQLAELEAKIKAEYDAKIARLGELEQENRTLKLDTKVKDVYAKHGVLPERIDDLWRLTAERFDLTAEGSPLVKDAPTTKLEQYVETLKKSHPWAFAAPAASGGGAKGAAGLPGGTPDEQFKAILANPAAILAQQYESAA